MKTPYYNPDISQSLRGNFKPYGIGRQELDRSAMATAIEIIKRRINKDSRLENRNFGGANPNAELTDFTS